MRKYSKSAGLILIGGLAGITGVLVTVISDLILLGRPVNADMFFRLGTESMAGMAQWRITFGTFLGVFVLPLQIAGLIPFYVGLKPAGKLMPAVVTVMNAHAVMMGVAFHVSYAYIGSGWKLFYGLGSGNTAASGMIKSFDFYWRILVLTMLAEISLASAYYVFAILKRKTLFPKWMALLNPLVVFIVMYPLIYFIPAPVGGYIAPGYLNLSTMAFFILSTSVVYKRLNTFAASNSLFDNRL